LMLYAVGLTVTTFVQTHPSPSNLINWIDW
jgi:hypothetical protein